MKFHTASLLNELGIEGGEPLTNLLLNNGIELCHKSYLISRIFSERMHYSMGQSVGVYGNPMDIPNRAKSVDGIELTN